MSIRTLSFTRPIHSYLTVQKFFGNLIRGSKLQLKPSVLSKPYLNIGCGGNFHDDFIAVDYLWRPGIDLCWDITKRIPLGDGTLQGVYSEHCLEHIPLDACVRLLRDFHRMLRPGSTIRIAVPDGERILRLYVKAKEGESNELPLPDETPIMAVNRHFRDHGHQFIYDHETFEKLLLKAGFKDVKKEMFRHGRDPKLLIDTPRRAFESLYVEATRP